MVASIEENLADRAQARPVRYIFPPMELLTAGSGSAVRCKLQVVSCKM